MICPTVGGGGGGGGGIAVPLAAGWPSYNGGGGGGLDGDVVGGGGGAVAGRPITDAIELRLTVEVRGERVFPEPVECVGDTNSST